MKISFEGDQIFIGQGGAPWLEGQRTLVLQHGAGMDRTIWVLLARYFARHGFNVVTPDLPAHGASTGAALTSIDAQADFLWRLIDTLRLQHGLPVAPVILGGHSMGALIALASAVQRPEDVEQLLLFGCGYPMPVGQALLNAAEANDQAAVNMIVLYGHCFSSQLGHNAVAGISVQNTAMALLERAAPGVLHTDLAACNAYQCSAESALVLAGKPSTLIAGDSDRMTPMKMSRQLAELLGAQLVVLKNCGHMVMSEQPEQTLQAVRQALIRS